eukprot:5553657-Alexandrium_andersonii.AAC.1
MATTSAARASSALDAVACEAVGRVGSPSAIPPSRRQPEAMRIGEDCRPAARPGRPAKPHNVFHEAR